MKNNVKAWLCLSVALFATAFNFSEQSQSATKTKKAASKQAAPRQEAIMALRPVFSMRNQREPFQAGTAYVVAHPRTKRPTLVTAIHLLGPAGGLARQLNEAQINQSLRSVTGMSFSASPVAVVRAGRCVSRGGRPLDVGNSALYDTVAFDITHKSRQVQLLPLAKADAKRGEWVWAVGNPYSSSPEHQRTFAARVVGINAEGLNIQMASDFELAGFSGAPLLNAQRKVIGHIVGGSGRDIVAAPVSFLRRVLG